MSDRDTPVVERVLDAVGRLVAERGVTAVTMADVAAAAGCSRATLYRCFPDRATLDRAFVQREALRVGGLVTADLADVRHDHPDRLVVEGVLASLRRVRESPALLAWFTAPVAGRTAELAAGSEVVTALGLGVTEDPAAVRWLVRVIVSLLALPEPDVAAERELVERFVVPGVQPRRARRRTP